MTEQNIEENSDVPLFSMTTGKQTTPRKKRAPKKDIEPAPKTPDGYDSQQILASWIDFVRDNTGTTPPSTIISRMGRQVKTLVKDGYHSKSIKQGMVIWLGRWMENASTNPEQLPNIVWHLSVTSNSLGQQYMAEYRRFIEQFSPSVQKTAGVRTDATQERESNSRAEGQNAERLYQARMQKKKEQAK